MKFTIIKVKLIVMCPHVFSANQNNLNTYEPPGLIPKNNLSMKNSSVVDESEILKSRPVKRINLRKGTSFLLGSLALFAVVFLWTFSSYLTSHVLDYYDQPFIITIVSSLTFLVYFVFLIIPDPLMNCAGAEEELNLEDKGDQEQEEKTELGTTTTFNRKKLPPLTLIETSRVALIFFILYFLSNCLLNFSLGSGDLASVSNLASTSGFFTLILGYLGGVEILSSLRLGAVGLSLVATLLTVLPEFSFSSKTSQAAIFALSSAFTYGLYSIYLKKVTKDESRVSMPMLFAFVGLYTLIFIVPCLGLAHLMGWYVIQTPSRDAVVNICINAVIGGLIPNYMWNVAFTLTTPLMVAIGLSFSTPLGVAAGYLKTGELKIESVWAAVIIILSFCLLNLASLNKSLDDQIDSQLLSLFRRENKNEKTVNNNNTV